MTSNSIDRNTENPQVPTQFRRALQEPGVELICAHSHQAKGRVERRNRVLQDRLVKELRERRFNDIDQADALLERIYLEAFNLPVFAARDSRPSLPSSGLSAIGVNR